LSRAFPADAKEGRVLPAQVTVRSRLTGRPPTPAAWFSVRFLFVPLAGVAFAGTL
jgi:hypothetical protein